MNIEQLFKKNETAESSDRYIKCGYFQWQAEYPNIIEWSEHSLTPADVDWGWLETEAFIKDDRFV
jgi:hypothetical protein